MFILATSIQEGNIVVKNSAGEIIEEGLYALINHKEYYLTGVVYATGVWYGNGKARITYLGTISQITCINNHHKFNTFLFSSLFFYYPSFYIINHII